VVDFSAGTPLHESNKQNLLIVYRLLEPFLVQMQGITEVEFSRLYTQLQHDLQQEQFCGLDYYLTVWGYKTA
jgi:Mn-dependent DtxR family transcriptional regulator